MGRELKRVPLDFQWEIGKLWSGYVNPHEVHECKDCEGLGWSKEYNILKDKWYGWGNENYLPNPFRKDCRYNANAWSNNLDQEDVDALIEADRLWDFTRVALNDEQAEIVRKKRAEGENSWLPFNNGYRPTVQEVNDWALKGMGHDSLNCSYVISAKLKREGKSDLCPNCDGTGEKWQSEEAKELHENWKKYDPPMGEGFQLWTTTSEGSPMTPVFGSLEDLCLYCEEEGVSVFGSNTTTKEEWMKMLSDGFVHHTEGNIVFL